MKPAPFFVACYLLLQGFIFSAQTLAAPAVEIEDRDAVTAIRATTTSGADTTSPASATSLPAGSRQNQLSEFFVQMQQLQREVQELRGLVEQQGFEIQTLKQQVKDNYLDVDKRLSALSSGAAISSAATNTVAADSNSAAESLASGAEKDSYDAAYKLLDQNRKDDAMAAFRKHVMLYPTGDLAANAYYWMGQICLTQGQLDLAQEQFATLLKNFPGHRKAPDAKFALGKVYFQQGKKAEAKKIIQEISQGDSKTAALAKTFLQDNF